MASRFKVDGKKFNLVKTLDEAGVKAGQIQKIAGISNCTLNNIRHATDLEDYQKIVREQFRKKDAYDKAKEQREILRDLPLDQYITSVGLEQPKVQEAPKKGYTVTMVINVDEEHDSVVAPLTALINSMFTPNNVAVEVQRSDS